MQSELPEVLQNTSVENTAVEELSTAFQHGRQPEDASTPPGFSHRGWEGVELQRAEHGGILDASVSSERDSSSDQDIARLKRPSPPPGNRISEYENALTPSPRRRAEELAFHVVNTSRKPDDKRSPIANMPNEILTHALSHLAPSDLSSVALVSRRFHSLVTSPHAWRIAFSRFFPGSGSLAAAADDLASEDSDENLRSERRAFTRLTALASWRSEYILRSRLLRSLARGKPIQILASPNTSRSGQGHTASSTIMYNSQLFTTVNHLHATFGTGLNKRFPRFIHGADDVGTASTSDPTLGKIDNWGSSDPQFFLQFFERFPGDTQWGLGPGEVIGNPNVMDVSQPYGMVHGEGSPGGMVYLRCVDEMRGRFLASSLAISVPELGIPKVSSNNEAICSVWIAKSFAVPSFTEGVIGILSGSSAGIVSAYSLGSDGMRDARLTRGELTARWVLSPGVPIIAITVDDSYSLKRHAQNRIWAVALNALGELFYLTKVPKRGFVERDRKPDAHGQERLAWATGRSVYWNLVEPSRRAARPNPYNESSVDGSYSPRSSWNGMCLSKDQIKAETREIETYLDKKPKDFQKACLGWDMQRRLEVDFAGDDGNLAGESLVVFECGIERDNVAAIKRFMRCKIEEKKDLEQPSIAALTQLDDLTPTMEKPSLFGGAAKSTTELPVLMNDRNSEHQRARRLSCLTPDGLTEHASFTEEWRCSELSFGGSKSVEITATAIDMSTFALLTMSEDPALGFAGTSGASSPFASPVSSDDSAASATDIPGQRARFVAAGTKAGNVFLWNIRAPAARNAELVNVIDPVRVIYTDSPQISCLALTALQLVHGGDDGLVQAWDPLASSSQPIRTLHSRFSSRARRRLVQAQASPQGVGINLFAAGAICLDPDPTVLRGMVSLGTHLRYWSYSSSAADQYKSHKRRLRRSERSSNNGGGGFSATGRTNNLKDYIAVEKLEVEHEKKTRQRESDRLAGRFGTDLLGSEEEALAYATLLSEESLAEDLRRRASESTARAATPAASTASVGSTDFPTPPSSSVGRSSSSPTTAQDEYLDPDLAEAIRLSLGGDVADAASYAPASPDPVGHDVPLRYAKSRKSPTASRRGSPVGASAEWKAAKERDELEFALQLSLAEEQSRKEMEEKGESSARSPSDRVEGKGKGRA